MVREETVLQIAVVTLLTVVAFVSSFAVVVGYTTVRDHMVVLADDHSSAERGVDQAASLSQLLRVLRRHLNQAADPRSATQSPSLARKRSVEASRRRRKRLVASHGRPRAAPFTGESSLENPDDTMFISISSFRDLQCAPTIYDMYAKAAVPRNVFVGAVEQHEPGDPSCVPTQYVQECVPTEWCPSDNIMTRVISPRVAKGPTFGRYYGALMYRGEKYFMMIDSHNRWVTRWDSIVIRMHKGLPTSKGVLAHYPEAWINPEDNGKETNAPMDNRASVSYMCRAHWIQEFGFYRMGGYVIGRTAKYGKDVCRPQPFAGAGFVFSLGKMVEEVPFDPHLPYIFDGEELMYTVRMWTHGWDIFSPSENILYHYYYRSKANKFWSILPSDWGKTRDASLRRIQYMLKSFKPNTTQLIVPSDTTEKAVLVELDRYGLGTERTLEQYYEYAGVDRKEYKFTKDFCLEHAGVPAGN